MVTGNPVLLQEPSTGHHHNPERLCIFNQKTRMRHDFECKGESNSLEDFNFFLDFQKSQSTDSPHDQFRRALKSIRPKIGFRVLSKCGLKIPDSQLFRSQSARSGLGVLGLRMVTQLNHSTLDSRVIKEKKTHRHDQTRKRRCIPHDHPTCVIRRRSSHLRCGRRV